MIHATLEKINISQMNGRAKKNVQIYQVSW